MKETAALPLPFVSTAHGSAAVSTEGLDNIMLCVGTMAKSISHASARDLAKALTACLARVDRILAEAAKKPDPTQPTAPPSGWVEPARMAA